MLTPTEDVLPRLLRSSPRGGGRGRRPRRESTGSDSHQWGTRASAPADCAENVRLLARAFNDQVRQPLRSPSVTGRALQSTLAIAKRLERRRRPVDGKEQPLTRDALRSATPRSRNSIPEPATRSLTVLETSTSPGSASAATQADMHGYAADFAADKFTFAGVEAGAHVEAKFLHRRGDRAGAADRACWPVERGEEAIPSSVDLRPTESRELPPNQCVMLLE